MCIGAHPREGRESWACGRALGVLVTWVPVEGPGRSMTNVPLPLWCGVSALTCTAWVLVPAAAGADALWGPHPCCLSWQ